MAKNSIIVAGVLIVILVAFFLGAHLFTEELSLFEATKFSQFILAMFKWPIVFCVNIAMLSALDQFRGVSFKDAITSNPVYYGLRFAAIFLASAILIG